jgi:hypothetical protein
MAIARRLLRTLLTLLLLCGMGLSFVEGAGCNETFEVQGGPVATAEWAHPGPSGQSSDCCACIHTYPNNFTVAVVSIPVIFGYTSEYVFLALSGPDRSLEPLLPPPIV